MRIPTMAAVTTSLLYLLLLLLCGLLGCFVLSVCPSVCSCSQGHRVVDCSSRGLTKLPPGLQHNIHFLNLSFNRLQVLDSQLSHYVHLRTLDLSYNRLDSLPPALPRSLWNIRVAGNHLRSLDKNDTVYHWNLKELDLSDNELERVVFINNTLPSLQALNLSHNRFWTVPTNMPNNLESIDLSYNYLAQILPGSLDRLLRLAQFILHANRFSSLSEGIFDKLKALEVITLGDNPWACEDEENMAKLLRWAEQTSAKVLGCPCYTKPICGKAHKTIPGREWYSQMPTRTAEVTSSYLKSELSETELYQEKRGVNESGENMAFAWTSSTSIDSVTTYTSTIKHPQYSTQKPKEANSWNNGQRLLLQAQLTITMNFLVTTAAFSSF